MKKIGLIAFLMMMLQVSSFADNLSGNSISIPSAGVLYNDTATILIHIDNTDPYVAFQLDIQIPSVFTFVSGSVVLDPARRTDHILSYQWLTGNTLRIISYSPSNDFFTGNSGIVASFKLKAGTTPGNYTLNILDPVIGDTNSSNILTSYTNGSLILEAPNVYIGNKQMNFGQIPLGNSETRSLVVSNTGNLPLNISSISINNPYFVVLNTIPLIISANSQVSIQIQFTPIIKGTFIPTISISSGDPDENPIIATSYAVAYTINEIHAISTLTHSGDTSTLVFSINDYEPMVSFQFDLTLPSPAHYLPGMIALSNRKTDHVISANLINGNTLRVLAYSPTNQPFTGNDGNILFLPCYIEGPQGYYSLNLTNCVIGNEIGENVCSQKYNGTLEVAAPDISSVSIINFGDVNILETGNYNLIVHNVGTDILHLNQLVFSNSVFSSNATLPIIIGIGQQASIGLSYFNPNKGQVSETLKIRSDDPDEDPFNISLQAYSFVPNYASVGEVNAYFVDTVEVAIFVDNYEDFNSFQFDLTFPEDMTFLPDLTRLSARAQNHLIYSSIINSYTTRVFGYSLTIANFLGSSGEVAFLSFAVNANTVQSYPLILQNVILGGDLLDNILYSASDGQINITGPNPSLSCTWTGSVDRLWYHSGNWNNGIPGLNSSVIIPGSPLNQPILSINTSCRKLTLQPGSELIIDIDKQLNLSDSLIIQQTSPTDSTKLIIKGKIVIVE